MSAIRMNRTDGTSVWWVNGQRVAKPTDVEAIWSEERTAYLRKHWGKKSAAMIARELGCFTHCRDGGKNAVIGRANRIGLPQIKGTPRMRAPWTNERCASLRAMWLEPSVTVTQIMEALNSTRDAIEKQAVRMGLPSKRSINQRRSLQVRRYVPNST